MKTFIKLFNFEFNRFLKLFLSLLIFMFVIQMIGTIISAFAHNRMVNNLLSEGMTETSIQESVGLYHLGDLVYHLYFVGPLFISFVAILFYTFFIWYRDWFGKTTFIYRLLTLPSSRMNVYFAKFATIIILQLSIIAFQLIIIFIQSKVVEWIVPNNFRIDLSVGYIVRQFELIEVIFPVNVLSFLFAHFLIAVFIMVIFTAILFERSYRMIGFGYGAAYFILMFILQFSPLMSHFIIGIEYFYSSELMGLMLLAGIVVMVISLFVSRHLIKKKVSV